jgi:hypothetical protein
MKNFEVQVMHKENRDLSYRSVSFGQCLVEVSHFKRNPIDTKGDNVIVAEDRKGHLFHAVPAIYKKDRANGR